MVYQLDLTTAETAIPDDDCTAPRHPQQHPKPMLWLYQGIWLSKPAFTLLP
jgi:hypothetical protein